MRRLVDQYKASPAVRELAVSLTRGIPQKDFSAEISALFYFVRDNIRYLKDVDGIETLQTPLQTLRLRAGDCDDKVTLLGALLESIGHPVRFRALGFGRGLEHVIAECYNAGQWVALDATEPVNIGWSPPGAQETMTNRSNLAGLDIGNIVKGAVTGFVSSGGNPYMAAAGGAAGAVSGGGGGAPVGGAGPGYPYNSLFTEHLTAAEKQRWGPAGPCPRWFPGVNKKATNACDDLAKRVSAKGIPVVGAPPSPTPTPGYGTGAPGYVAPLVNQNPYSTTQYLPVAYTQPQYAPEPEGITDNPWFWPLVVGGGVLFLGILMKGRK